MKKIIIILGILILATTAFFLFKPQQIGTGTRTKMVYLDRENTFTATTTLENGFVSTSTPTQAGQIVGLDEDGKLPAVDGSQLLNLEAAPAFLSVVSDTLVTSGGGASFGSDMALTKLKEIEFNDAAGNIRVYFGGVVGNNLGGEAYFRVYKNGVAVGTQRTIKWDDTGGQYYNEDIAVETGDLIQLYVSSGPKGSGTVGAFNLKYVKSVITATNTVNL